MKKTFKILIIILVIFCLILIGRKIYYNNVGVEPEDLYITKEGSDEQFKASKGAYKWNDKGMQVIADSVGATQIDFVKAIEVKPNDKLYFNDCNWSDISSFVILEQENKDVARISIESNLEDNYIVVPRLASNEYVIQINLKSTKGNVWYAIKLNITD